MVCRRVLLTVLLLVGWVALAPPAWADELFTINVPNADISAFPGPYASADVHLNSSTLATITFTSDTTGPGGFTYLMGAENAVDVNVNATSWTLGPVTGTNTGSGFSPGPYSNVGSGTVDGFGTFNQGIDSADGFTHSATQVTFTLTNTSGTWADASKVLKGQDGTASDPGSVAIHVFVTPAAFSSETGAVATGFADNGAAGVPFIGPPPPPPLPVPEPGTLLLLGSGLAGLGMVTRRRGR